MIFSGTGCAATWSATTAIAIRAAASPGKPYIPVAIAGKATWAKPFACAIDSELR
jgi:hypothetical protein